MRGNRYNNQNRNGLNNQRGSQDINRRSLFTRTLGVIGTVVVIGVIGFGSIFFLKNNRADTPASTDKPGIFSGTNLSSNIEENLPVSVTATGAEQLYSKEAILVELDKGSVLMEKESQKKIYPASLTKIMTAVVVLDGQYDLDQRVTLEPGIFDELYAQDASMAGFLPGEEVTVRDLLYGVMLPSGAESCIGLAEFTSGTEADFADKMNRKAQELGMKNTHFCNSTGLHEEEHYTTVADLAVLLQYALENETFREIFTTSRYSVMSTNMNPEGITFYSTLFKNMDSTQVTSGEIEGGKTGYTQEAGLCLASLAKVNGKEYILVTAGADGNHETSQFHIEDAIVVYNGLE